LINPTGNPGMAKAWTGDILAGMTARFLAGWVRRYRGVDFGALADYLSAAIYLHGLAGDLAAQDKGMESMVATDLLEHLPAAFRQVLRG
jgi:NAD(P)H-hydrate repair Nnr-like enzyme with NAD(P)H-hydrate dehydratase domain